MTATVIHNIPADGATWAHCTPCGWQGPMHARGALGDREAQGDRDQHNDERHPILIHVTQQQQQQQQQATPDQVEAAKHILGHYGHIGGVQAGSFTTSLISTWEKADYANRARLAMAFPDMAWAIDHIQREGGSVQLQQIVKDSYRDL